MKTLDQFDLKLLEQIQQNNRLTAEELGQKVCLSASAVHRRLRRLRENEIIEREVAIVSPQAVGRIVAAIIEVTLDADGPQVLQRSEQAVHDASEVMQVCYVTGNRDFVLIVTVKTMQNNESFAHRFLSKKLHVKHFRTSVVMRQVKTGLAQGSYERLACAWPP